MREQEKQRQIISILSDHENMEEKVQFHKDLLCSFCFLVSRRWRLTQICDFAVKQSKMVQTEKLGSTTSEAESRIKSDLSETDERLKKCQSPDSSVCHLNNCSVQLLAHYYMHVWGTIIWSSHIKKLIMVMMFFRIMYHANLVQLNKGERATRGILIKNQVSHSCHFVPRWSKSFSFVYFAT